MAVDLTHLSRATWDYFAVFGDHPLGLVADRSEPDSVCSIAAIGFGLTCLPIAVERGYLTPIQARRRALATLRFLDHSDQSGSPSATGHRGFYYHFLDRVHGRRAGTCELSSIDTALLMAGVLLAARYFAADTAEERELRELADRLYDRVQWDWLLAHTPPAPGVQREAPRAIGHGWTPERGFIPFRWEGHTEALILYALATGARRHAIPAASYLASCAHYRWSVDDGIGHLAAPPLFIHQYPQVWIDGRGIADAFMASHACDYAENARRAAHLQSRYAQANPLGFAGYHRLAWGFTAGDGPGPLTITHLGRPLQVHDYLARGAPHGIDDGTIAPWAVAASLPFDPDLALATLDHLLSRHAGLVHAHGLVSGINPTVGWTSTRSFGLDQGPVLALLENHRSGLIWRLMQEVTPLVAGLTRMGFHGGWLATPARWSAAS